MSKEIYGELDSSIQAKIDSDTDFQTQLESTPEEEREQVIADRKAELFGQEILSIKQKAEKNEELANNYKIRAEKAEKGSKEKPEPKSETGLSQKDVIYLAKADIDEQDLDDVIEYANLKKIPVSEAHKFMNPILKERAEERKTAQATVVKTGNRGASKNTPESILADVRSGKEVDPEVLAKARMELKLKK